MTPTSGIEYLVWLLIAAAITAMLAKRLRIPYTVALVFGGLLLGAVRFPLLSPLQSGNRPDWLTPDVTLILFLPALVFEGSVKLDLRELVRNSIPCCCWPTQAFCSLPSRLDTLCIGLSACPFSLHFCSAPSFLLPILFPS
jgi:hypothetical protein